MPGATRTPAQVMGALTNYVVPTKPALPGIAYGLKLQVFCDLATRFALNIQEQTYFNKDGNHQEETRVDVTASPKLQHLQIYPSISRQLSLNKFSHVGIVSKQETQFLHVQLYLLNSCLSKKGAYIFHCFSQQKVTCGSYVSQITGTVV